MSAVFESGQPGPPAGYVTGAALGGIGYDGSGPDGPNYDGPNFDGPNFDGADHDGALADAGGGFGSRDTPAIGTWRSVPRVRAIAGLALVAVWLGALALSAVVVATQWSLASAPAMGGWSGLLGFLGLGASRAWLLLVLPLVLALFARLGRDAGSGDLVRRGALRTAIRFGCPCSVALGMALVMLVSMPRGGAGDGEAATRTALGCVVALALAAATWLAIGGSWLATVAGRGGGSSRRPPELSLVAAPVLGPGSWSPMALGMAGSVAGLAAVVGWATASRLGVRPSALLAVVAALAGSAVWIAWAAARISSARAPRPRSESAAVEPWAASSMSCAWIGATLALGIVADALVFWWLDGLAVAGAAGGTIEETVGGVVRHSSTQGLGVGRLHPLYDACSALGRASLLPAGIYFLRCHLTHAAKPYRRLVAAIASGRSVEQIGSLRAELFDGMRTLSRSVLRVQGAILLGMLWAGPWVLEAVGIGRGATPILQRVAIGAVFELGLMVTLANLWLVGAHRAVWGTAIAFGALNLTLSALSIQLGPWAYGGGYALAAWGGFLVGWWLLRSRWPAPGGAGRAGDQPFGPRDRASIPLER